MSSFSSGSNHNLSRQGSIRGTCSSGSSNVAQEYCCKFCPDKTFKSSILFISHLHSQHASAEGGSYTCRYGDNGICNRCPAVGISQEDYRDHVSKHHVTAVAPPAKTGWQAEPWHVLSSTVNLPAVLNDPGKGKQKDFFTRSWGAEFVDTSILPSSPHICELPPGPFDRYLRKVRKYYSRNVSAPSKSLATQTASGFSSSRETTPSPLPSPSKKSPSPPREVPNKLRTPSKLNIPDLFLDPNFDLSNPSTFNSVFPFISDSLSEEARENPFTIEPAEARLVESSGKLVQERLQHYIDQVEVCIAGQVASKSHHFFQVMTYHDALMSQLVALISVVSSLRRRLKDVELGVVQCLRVPQRAIRKQNLEDVLAALGTLETMHKTQPTIQVLLARQEFTGALDLISTSQDILANEAQNVDALKQLPSQLDELMSIIEKMLLSDFKEIVKKELDRDIPQIRAIDQEMSVDDTLFDDGHLSSIVTALARQGSFSFLEHLEEEGVATIKNTIKEVVLLVLDPKEDTTLTSLVADFALQATNDGWSDLLDLLVGSLLLVLSRLAALNQTILAGLSNKDVLGDFNGQEDKVKSTVNEVFLNICDQVHERLGKLLTVRSRPQAIKLVSTEELSKAHRMVDQLSKATTSICGKPSSGLQLSLQGQTIIFIQQFHEACRGQVLTSLESEKWKKSSCKEDLLANLHLVIRRDFKSMANVQTVADYNDNSQNEVHEIITTNDEKFSFVDSVILFLRVISDYCMLCEQLPLACVEISMKSAELFKLFNSRSCQLVLGAGAVNMAGLKTITIRNLAIALRSLALISRIIPAVKRHLLTVCPGNTEKQETTVGRNFDSASKDYGDHLSELDRKIVQIADSSLNQQLSSWDRKPPVPSNSFKNINKQLNKLLEAIQDILPASEVTKLFKTMHLQFLNRVGEKLKEAKLVADNSPTHGLILSELIFYRENLKYMNILPPDELSDSSLQMIWKK